MLSLCRQTERQIDGCTTIKQYSPNLSIRGGGGGGGGGEIKKKKKENNSTM